MIIESVNVSQEHGYYSHLLRGPVSSQSVLKENARSFWFRKPKDRTPVKHGVGNCGKPLPICMDLVCKGCPSRCLPSEAERIKKCDEEKRRTAKAKAKTVEDKLTWWEMIFGPSPKRFWPDPCTCRLAHREKKKTRAQDPRLRDPRYQMTAGDVFLYTESIKQGARSCFEPQPKPPPAYKMPRAALVRIIGNLCDQPPVTRTGLSVESPECKTGSRMRSYRITYEEMRPPEKRRKPFICYEGVPMQDILPPINKDLHIYQGLQKQSNQQCNMIKDFEDFQKSQSKACEDDVDPSQMFHKRSRVEQLKILVNRSETSQYLS